jgi:hypothetical protein
MRSRAVLLAYPGDPFLLNYWLSFFDNGWAQYVDALYIGLNSPVEDAVLAYIYARIEQSRVKTGVTIVVEYQNHMADHGPTINKLLDLCTQDYVMMIEDDGFIFKPEVVDWAFTELESGRYDIVGSKRGSCSEEITHAAFKKWGISYEGEGDQGPNFWPNFFFTKKEILLQTDRNFAAKAWHKGDYIAELDYTVLGDVIYGDTFVNTSIQLRGLIPQHRIKYTPQYHGHPEDLMHAQRGKYLFDGVAPWTHVGSLSSGISGVLRDEFNRPLDRRTVAMAEEKTTFPPEWCQSDMEKMEWERRVQWWLTFYNRFGEVLPQLENPGIEDFYKVYGRAIEQIINQFGLSLSNIRKRQMIYKDMLGI